MSKFWAPTLESISTLISIVPPWFWVFVGTRARWLSKKPCLWDNSNCQAARGISCELFVLFWTRSFTAIVTESSSKSRLYWISSLETKNIRFSCKLTVSWLVDSRLNLSKTIWKMNMTLKSSANRKRIRVFHIWTQFNLFWFRFGCAWLWLAEKLLQKSRGFFS